MAPTLETTSGKPVEIDPDAVNAKFQAAMNDDVPAEGAPPKRQPKPAADPDAPAPRRGRPPKAEKARTADKIAAPIKDSYVDDAHSLVENTWMLLALSKSTQPYALPLVANSDAWVSGLAEGAKHSKMIRSLVSQGGGNSWLMTLVAAGVMTGMQVRQIMSDPQFREQAAEATREHLKTTLSAKGIQVQEPGNEPAAA